MQQVGLLQRSYRVAALAAAVIWVAAFGLRPVAPVMASCGGTTLVGTTAELNAAIDDFNSQAGPCDFTIELENDIALSNNINEINNANANVSLTIDGAGFTLDGVRQYETFYINNTPEVSFDRLTIANSDSDGIYSSGTGLRITRTTIVGSDTDAVDFSNGDLLVSESTFSGNGSYGVDIYNNWASTTATLINTTVANNNSNGIAAYDSTVLLTHVTVSGNGYGLDAYISTVTVNNSILGANIWYDCYSTGATLDINHSLVQVDDQCGLTDGVDGNIVGHDPLLGILGDYGGPTKTVPPAEFTGIVTLTSPVIDEGDDALSVDENATTLDFDQRGPGFPRNGGAAVDMGAFEGTVEINCAATTVLVSNEVELNEAILCFNRLTSAVAYTIEFEADIDLTTNLTRIRNSTNDISLLIDGAGYTLDGMTDYDTFVINDTPTVEIDQITITGSFDDGIDSSLSNLRVSRTTITRSDSDGIEFEDGDLVVVESTLVDNADNAIDASANSVATPITVINSTISANAWDGNWAVYLYNVDALFTHVTIYQNDLGLVADFSNVVINNSILAGNDEEDCVSWSSTVEVNNSLVQSDSPFDPCGVTNGVDGNIVGENPFLSVLGNFGGPTQTHPPLNLSGGVTATSPVINVGDDALSDDENGATLTTDQRGAGFPRKIGARVDMGAVEGTRNIVCAGFPVTVNNEQQLNNAILCYNAITTAGVYTISLGNDIDLTASTIAIDNDSAGVSLIINGNGRVIDGQDTLGVRPVTVRPDTSVTLNNATITGGNIEDGGGISNEGDMTLNGVNVVGNTTDNDGGGIFNDDDATMAINDSVINGNTAIYPDGDGGGISNEGHMTITDSAVSGNVVYGDESVWGGGIWNEGTLAITRSTISNNSIYADYDAYGGGIVNEANLVIRDSAVTGNGVHINYENAYGGGVYSEADDIEVLDDGHGAQLTIINSTISNNTVAGDEDILGGGLYATDGCCLDDPIPVKLINVTVAGNSVEGDLDVIGSGAYFDLDYSDVGLDVKIHNSILADNLTNGAADGDCVRDTDPELVFESLYSLYGDTGGDACELAAANPDADGNIVGEAPVLDGLANNGGPTLTHLPGALSPAIDSGNNALADDENGDPLTADQRGYTPRVVNGTVDMGAVEVGAEPPTSLIAMSATLPGTTGDGVAFGMEDILEWDGSGWSLFFDGSAAGLTPTGKWKHNINAFSINGGEITMSFTQNARFVPGIVPKVDGMDLVKWDGSAFSLWFDGSDVGLTNKTQEKIDGLHILPGSESPIGGGCIAYLLVSTQGPGRVTKYGGGQIRFGGEDVLGFCMTNAGANTSGFWHMVLDGSVEGMPKNATDSISFSPDGDTMYLTTKGNFNVDAAAGGHSMVYKYDFGSGSFSGPFFNAPANGLPRVVDGLQVVGDLP